MSEFVGLPVDCVICGKRHEILVARESVQYLQGMGHRTFMCPSCRERKKDDD